jgi:hypothetical protein
MLLMIAPGIVSLVFGIAFLGMPQLVSSRPSTAKGWVETDAFFRQHRVSSSVCFIAVGLFCLSSAYYVWLRFRGF